MTKRPFKEVDPFDESNFVEKAKVDPVKQREEVLSWQNVSQGTTRVRREKEVQDKSSGPSREYDKTINVKPTYEFGDKGSSWRMMKLRSLREAARSTNRNVEDVAFDRYGTLEKYDEALEEEEELARRPTYGIGKTVPCGDLYQARLAKDRKHEVIEQQHDRKVVEEIKMDEMTSHGQTVSIGDLNKLKARLLKAQMMQSGDAKHLQDEYDAAAKEYNDAAVIVILPEMDSRGQAIEKNEDDMTIEDLVREEKRESRGRAQSRRDADRIARDVKYTDTLDYQDENADRLASRIKSKEINLKNTLINDFQRINKVLDACPLCHHNDGEEPPMAPVIALGTRVFLTLSSAPLTRYHCVIAPIQHHVNTVDCDDDESLEIRNFMKSLTKMFASLGKSVMFYENSARPWKHGHAGIECIPYPAALSNTVPRYWMEAMTEDWATHRRIDTTGNTFHRKMSSRMPFFHVWFDLNGGIGHIIEDEKKWPRDDLFGREVCASILGLDVTVWRKRGEWLGSKDSAEEKAFHRVWDRWDWTKSLTE